MPPLWRDTGRLRVAVVVVGITVVMPIVVVGAVVMLFVMAVIEPETAAVSCCCPAIIVVRFVLVLARLAREQLQHRASLSFSSVTSRITGGAIIPNASRAKVWVTPLTLVQASPCSSLSAGSCGPAKVSSRNQARRWWRHPFS